MISIFTFNINCKWCKGAYRKTDENGYRQPGNICMFNEHCWKVGEVLYVYTLVCIHSLQSSNSVAAILKTNTIMEISQFNYFSKFSFTVFFSFSCLLPAKISINA